MPRQKLSEYRAKKIVIGALGVAYDGWAVKTDAPKVTGHTSYVVKVDQGVKGRFKKRLVLLEVPESQLSKSITKLRDKGFDSFLIEPYVSHTSADERYLNMRRDTSGITVSVSRQGGIDIEGQADSIETFKIDSKTDWSALANVSGIENEVIKTLVRTFETNFFTFLEINPYLVQDGSLTILDLAVEVDDAAQHLVDEWSADDLRTAPRSFSEQEKSVYHLNETSPASFTLQMIHPDGAIFLLLSGGGASVVVADEIYSAGLGKELANYGEYSGNPTLEETYVYASAVLSLMIASKAQSKVLFIGGAVANFTNIEKTFAGIIRAIDEYAEELKKQNVKIVVRRGGPHQKAGLDNIRRTLERHGLLGGVYDPRTSIGDAVNIAIKEIQR
jgi:ATP-citrate lyase beta-subunit